MAEEKGAPYLLFASLFFQALALAGTSAPLAEMLLSRGCTRLGLEKMCDDHHAEHWANSRLQWVNLCMHLPQLFTVSLISHLGDVHGRKYMLLIPILGALGTNLTLFLWPLSYFWYMLPVISLLNCTGGSFSALGLSMACVADVTARAPGEERQRLFALTEGVFWIGFLIAPFATGWLAQHIGEQQAFAFPSAALLATFIIITMSRDSLPDTRRSKFNISRANPISLIQSLFVKSHVIARVVVVLFLVLLGVMITSTASTPFLRNHWKFNNQTIGYLACALYASNCFGLLVIAPMLQRCKLPAKWLLFSSTVCAALYPGVLTLGVYPFLITLPCVLVASALPLCRVVVSAQFSPSEYGTALGSMSAVETFVQVVGTTLGPRLLDWVGWRYTFMIGSVSPVLALLIILTLPPLQTVAVSNNNNKTENNDNNKKNLEEPTRQQPLLADQDD